MTKFNKRLLVFCILPFIVLGCDNEQNVQVKEVARPVKTQVIGSGHAAPIRKFPAVVEATEDAEMTFKVSGELTELLVRAGDKIEQGQTLARLDQKDYQIAFDQAKANYDLARSQFSRMEAMHGKGLISASDYDQSKAQLHVSKAALDSAKLNLEYTELKAPFSGYVSKLFIDNYENIVAKQPILHLVSLGTIDIAIQVPEEIMSRAKKNLQYSPQVYFDSHKQKQYKADIKEFDTQSDPATNTYKVVFSLPHPDEFNVLPGMTATVLVDMNIVLEKPMTPIVLPSHALFSDKDTPDAQSYVWLVGDDMRLKKTSVKTGDFIGDGINILDGLKLGDTVVVAGVHRLTENQLVSFWQQERGL